MQMRPPGRKVNVNVNVARRSNPTKPLLRPRAPSLQVTSSSSQTRARNSSSRTKSLGANCVESSIRELQCLQVSRQLEFASLADFIVPRGFAPISYIRDHENPPSAFRCTTAHVPQHCGSVLPDLTTGRDLDCAMEDEEDVRMACHMHYIMQDSGSIHAACPSKSKNKSLGFFYGPKQRSEISEMTEAARLLVGTKRLLPCPSQQRASF
ncbi:hypothetical protein HRR83_006363 [Exophiala dermatitidis]|nr:hypothetical protein HRR73_007221 [Exophiala dermatitidis]KAJ4509554.1 hypothetical protein HRR74_007335 [Exophiala dermatitidis]KAJ4593504.1 hypothetical protein HRR83_006363 [Exophiala dermatitidis]